MVQDAREVRQGLVQDSTLRSYSSTAHGFVYFYLDRPENNLPPLADVELRTKDMHEKVWSKLKAKNK